MIQLIAMKASIMTMLEICKEAQKNENYLYVQGQIDAYEATLRMINRQLGVVDENNNAK